MHNYFTLAEQFTTQSEPAYCGPASLTMVLNAMQIDPHRKWKGVWRWFSEEILMCTSQEQMMQGMTLEEMTILARCNGVFTSTFRAGHGENVLKSKKIEYIESDSLHKHNQDDERCMHHEHKHMIKDAVCA